MRGIGELPRFRIEICGGIASGKTTLARLARRMGFEVALEKFRLNPFWKAFYEDPGKYVLETEITFLLQHYHAILTNGRWPLVTDFSFVLDRAYADIGFAEKVKDIFLSIDREIGERVGAPGLIIFLSCGLDEEMRRIRKRSRREEGQISPEFLGRLNDAVGKRVAEFGRCGTVVELDSERLDFRSGGEDRASVGRLLKGLMGELRA